MPDEPKTRHKAAAGDDANVAGGDRAIHNHAASGDGAAQAIALGKSLVEDHEPQIVFLISAFGVRGA